MWPAHPLGTFVLLLCLVVFLALLLVASVFERPGSAHQRHAKLWHDRVPEACQPISMPQGERAWARQSTRP